MVMEEQEENVGEEGEEAGNFWRKENMQYPEWA